MKKIAIIGGGISGLYFANLLQKNQEYQYKVFEKKSYFELNDGYGIQLSVNSIKLLNDIGFKNIETNEIYFPKKINNHPQHPRLIPKANTDFHPQLNLLY